MSGTRTDRRGRERRGRLAETVAAWWLTLHGYRVIARRWESPVGEIDLIARRGRLVVFAEVKWREHAEDALFSLQPRQVERIARAAGAFLQRYRDRDRIDCRIDLIALAPWSWPRHVRGIVPDGLSSARR